MNKKIGEIISEYTMRNICEIRKSFFLYTMKIISKLPFTVRIGVWASLLSLFLIFPIVAALTSGPQEFGSVLSGVGSFFAFIWISIGLTVQMRELYSQNIMRRQDIAIAFLSQMKDNLDLTALDINTHLGGNIDRSIFDIREAPFALLKREDLMVALSNDAIRRDDKLQALCDTYKSHINYTIIYMEENKGAEQILKLFKRSIHFRLYEILI